MAPIALAALALLALSSFCSALDDRSTVMTLKLLPGKIECVWEQLNQGERLDITYQVLSGGQLDIDFTVFDPHDVLISHEQRSREGTTAHEVESGGQYRVCFSNSFSTMAEKNVFFELRALKPGHEFEWESEEADLRDNLVDISVQNVQNTVDRISMKIEHVTEDMGYFQHRMTRHMATAEDNLFRTTWFSVIECVVLVIVAVIQVYFIRSFFQDSRRIRL